MGNFFGIVMSKKIKLQLAREFRKNPTRSEKLMWNALRDRCFLNLKFRRQHVIDGYVLDFYCPELHVAVEIDGAVHSRHINEDIQRQTALEHNGIVFYRVKSENVESNINKVLRELADFVSTLTPGPSPASGRGESKDS